MESGVYVMALATKRWVDGRLEDVMDGQHPRRLQRPGAGGGMWATDYVWVGGKRLEIPENTNSYSYLKVYLDGTTTPVWIETMPSEDTMLEDSEIFDMRKMQIHLPGNFGV